ncbi:TonB-dependent receptor [Elongatibacter sediminis]|uniref:TonB-dependent receptor n=1 Tax=Elongatibacter sediminis TaxID=3119006 RepID=A0AAW9RC54_9GAMM
MNKFENRTRAPNRRILALTLVALGAAAGGVNAQQENLLEEVVVTAQKRAQNIQDVPIAITALTGKEIERFGFESAVQVAEQVPNFSVDGAFGPSGPPQLSIRGVSILDFSDANESSVAMYFDEIYKGTTSGQTSQLFDVERVEVLRGPQGTLYGRNTPGGLVHFISNRPTEEFEAGVSFQYGSFNQTIVEGMVSGPLSDNFRGRVAFKYNRDDGYQTNEALGSDFAETDVFAIRGSFEWDASDDLMVSAKVYYSDASGSHPGYGFYGTLDPVSGERCSLDRILSSECVNSSGFRDPDPDPEHVFSEFDSLPESVEIAGAALKFDWDLGDFTFVSITGYETVDKNLREDCDASSDSAPRCYGDWTGETKHQFTQEFRFSGQYGSADWIVGAYYYDDEKFVTVVIPPFGGFGSFATTEATSWAVFAQADTAISERVTLVTGLRYTEDDLDLSGLTGVTAGEGGTTQGDPFLGPISDSISTGKATGKIGLEWQQNDSTMYYGSISTGFKSGFFNTTLLGAPDERGPVGEESITSYEVGVKTTFWDDRARLNVAAFYYDYEDFQASAVSLIGGVPVSRFINAGDVTMSGAEFEFEIHPSPNWDFRLGVGLLDTEFDAPPDVQIGGTPIDGKEAPVSPSVSFNGLARYIHDMDDMGTVSAQVDFSWKDDLFFGPDNDPFESQDSFGLVNLRGSWLSRDGRYEVSVFVENVFDEEYNIFGFISTSSAFTGAYKVWGTPRRAGIRFGLNFQ